MKYVMRVTETLSRTVVVNAENCADARHKVENAYDSEQIVLDYRDYDGYEINVVRIACPGDIEMYEEVEVNK
jgi:hypothetical protein